MAVEGSAAAALAAAAGGAGRGRRAGVHVPGFDDVAQGVGHEERLDPASVFAKHLPIDSGVAYSHRHLLHFSQVVRAIPDYGYCTTSVLDPTT